MCDVIYGVAIFVSIYLDLSSLSDVKFNFLVCLDLSGLVLLFRPSYVRFVHVIFLCATRTVRTVIHERNIEGELFKIHPEHKINREVTLY